MPKVHIAPTPAQHPLEGVIMAMKRIPIVLALVLFALAFTRASAHDSSISVKVFTSFDGNLHAGSVAVAGAEVCFVTSSVACVLTDANGDINQPVQSGSAVTVTLTIPMGFACTTASCQAIITTHPYESRMLLWGIYPNAAHSYLPMITHF